MSIYQPGLLSEALVSNGQFNTQITSAQIVAGNVILKGAMGRLCRVLVTITTTGGQAITFYDNASTNSGNIVGLIPGGTTAGTVVDFEMPCSAGITIGQNASLAAGQITVSWL
jgi:hypothetical protein